MLSRLKTIIFSRIKKPKEDEEVLRKRSICKKCEFNSINVDNIPFNKLLLKKLSDFYSLLTGKKDEDSLGNCTDCGCSIFYKSAEDSEFCPKNKWNVD